MHTYIRTGLIQCRLLPGSEEICHLGRFLKEKWTPGRELAFVVQEKHHGRDAESIAITPIVIDRLIAQRRFSLEKISVRLSSKLAVTEIYLSVGDKGLHIISRFPRSLLESEGVRESKSLRLVKDFQAHASSIANSSHSIFRDPPRYPPLYQLYIKTMGWPDCQLKIAPTTVGTA